MVYFVDYILQGKKTTKGFSVDILAGDHPAGDRRDQGG